MQATALAKSERAGGGEFPEEHLRPCARLYKAADEAPSEHWVNKFEARASEYWERFFKQNGPEFFKDRHYLLQEWPSLGTSSMHVLEAGCGSGNTAVPLLCQNASSSALCLDFSPTAVAFTSKRAHLLGISHRLQASVSDIAEYSSLAAATRGEKFDSVLAVFTLSSLGKTRLPVAIHNLAHLMRQGAVLFIRDYAVGDRAQKKLSNHTDYCSQLSGEVLLRRDGTLAHYLDIPELRQLCADAGLLEISSRYIERNVCNRRQAKHMYRRFIQAQFVLQPHR